MEVERDVVLNVLRPYFLIHFRDLSFGESATPLDYDAISTDVEFLNLAQYRLEAVEQGQIPWLESGTSEVRDLLEAIAEELNP